MVTDKAEDQLLTLHARLGDINRWVLDAAIRGRVSQNRADDMERSLTDCIRLVGQLREEA